MPKSRHRKSRKPYRPKPHFAWGADPLSVFHKIGTGELGQDEEEAACLLLLREMGTYTPDVMSTICDAAGLSEPPATTDDIRAIARALNQETADASQP